MEELIYAVRELMKDRGMFLSKEHYTRLEEALRMAELERSIAPKAKPSTPLYITYWREGIGAMEQGMTIMHPTEDKAIEVARNAIDSGVKSAVVAVVTHKVTPARSINVEPL